MLDVHPFRQDITVHSLDLGFFFSSVDLGHPDDIAPDHRSLERNRCKSKERKNRRVQRDHAIEQKKMISPFPPCWGTHNVVASGRGGVRNSSTYVPPLCAPVLETGDPIAPLNIFCDFPLNSLRPSFVVCFDERLCCCCSPGISPAVRVRPQTSPRHDDDDIDRGSLHSPSVPDSWSNLTRRIG